MEITIKSKHTGTEIVVDEKGKFLLLDEYNGYIYLAKTRYPLANIKFATRKLLHEVAEQIIKMYGERLGYLGSVDWLSGIQQIHNAERRCFVFGDFLKLLERFDIPINEDIAQTCMQMAIEQNKEK